MRIADQAAHDATTSYRPLATCTVRPPVSALKAADVMPATAPGRNAPLTKNGTPLSVAFTLGLATAVVGTTSSACVLTGTLASSENEFVAVSLDQLTVMVPRMEL